MKPFNKSDKAKARKHHRNMGKQKHALSKGIGYCGVPESREFACHQSTTLLKAKRDIDRAWPGWCKRHGVDETVGWYWAEPYHGDS